MMEKAEEALRKAKEVAELVNNMIERATDLDVQRLLKQVEADLMDAQHKLSLAARLSRKD
jgi:hypothetical protein